MSYHPVEASDFVCRSNKSYSTTMTETFNAAAFFVDRHVDEGRGESIAIECGDERIAYRALQESVNRFGSALRDELGVRPEERVLLLTLDGPEMIYAFFGAIKIGAVPVPLNTLWTASDYDYVLRDARPRVLVVSASLLPRLGASPLAAYPWLRHIIVVGGEAADGIALVPCSRAPRRLSTRSQRAATRWRSGCIRRAAPAVPRPASTCSTTCACARKPTRRASCGSDRGIAASASPSSSSRTGSATACTSRSPSAPRRFSGPGR